MWRGRQISKKIDIHLERQTNIWNDRQIHLEIQTDIFREKDRYLKRQIDTETERYQERQT